MICGDYIKINYIMCTRVFIKKKKVYVNVKGLAKNLFSLNNVKINLKIEE